MALSNSQKAILERARALGSGGQVVVLTDDMCAYLVAVIAVDLGLMAEFPEFQRDPPPFFGQAPLLNLRVAGTTFVDLYERLLGLNPDADTYFVCLAALHKGRLKYDNILRTQPVSTIEQVGPRGLLQYGSLTPQALTGFLFWRKWFYDIDNRAAQETGYIFEPIIANAIGGTPAPGRKSPIKRRTDDSKGRQVDCIKGTKAYELKLRVTIAASGQGRWKEELDFPQDCSASGYTPVLIVLDSTANDKLTQLQNAFKSAGGETYVGAAAWKHLDDAAGPTMAQFLNKYVRDPLQALLAATPQDLPTLTVTMRTNAITIAIDDESITVARTPAPAAAADGDEMPEDATDQLPDTWLVDNLKRELPRIPFAPDFAAFRDAGRELAWLHPDYEALDEWPLTWEETPGVPLSYRVGKMKLAKDKAGLRVDESLALAGIPPAALDYRLGNQSALEWVVDQYQVHTNRRSGITSDPNRADDEQYIVRLVGQVVRVSVETVQIVSALPAAFSEDADIPAAKG